MPTSEDERALQLGLGDFALLARVQRPVPSDVADAVGRLGPSLPVIGGPGRP